MTGRRSALTRSAGLVFIYARPHEAVVLARLGHRRHEIRDNRPLGADAGATKEWGE
jgi:hypothetical protein